MQPRRSMDPMRDSMSPMHLLPISSALCVRDLAHEIEALREEASWRDDGYCMRILANNGDLRTVLFALQGGFRIRANRARGEAWIRVLTGHVELHAGDEWDMLPFPIRHTEGACSFHALYDHTIDLPTGSLLLLDPGLSHDVEALDDSAFILDVPMH